jgi:hypothetical protein
LPEVYQVGIVIETVGDLIFTNFRL